MRCPKILFAILMMAGLAFADAWTQLSPSGNSPPARWHLSGVYNSSDNSMIIFGGARESSVKQNDTWKLSWGTYAWSQLSVSGTLPHDRTGHSAIYNPTDNSMIIFGGHIGDAVNDTITGDVWKLSLGGTPTWTQLSPSGSAPATRHMHTAIYNPNDNSMIMFGGWGQGGSGDRKSDVWKLSFGGTPAWT
jgi:hypothetical protein